jgi:hypothetical protein
LRAGDGGAAVALRPQPGGSCLTISAGGKFDKKDAHDDGGGVFYFVAASDGAPLFDVTTYPKDKYEDHLASVKEDAKGMGAQKPLQSGDLPGGGFYYAVSYQNNGATETDDKNLPALLDACKSLRSL